MIASLSPLRPRPMGSRLGAEKLRPEAPTVSHGYFKSFDGTRLFYSSEGQGEPLIFCYGLVCSSLHWTYQISHFSKTHRAIWFDYRGHHNSDAPEDLSSLTIANMARDLRVLVDELGIERPTLLGHSMGVNVVLEFYRQNPDRARALVLANGTPRRPLETLFRVNALQAGFAALKKIHDLSPRLLEWAWKLQDKNPLARSLVAFGGFNPHLTAPEDIELYVKQVAEMDPAILVHLIQNYDTVDATPWLHEIKVPTLILAGHEDHIIPLEQQQLMAQLIPGAKLETIRHGSHCPQMDLPELVNAQIERFLGTL